MEYQEAKNLRGKKFTDLMTEKLLEGQGVGSSLGKTISEKTKAKVTGIKEAFDPMNIAKKLTFGSNLAPAIYGALFGRSEEDMRYFAGKGTNKTKEKGEVSKPVAKLESQGDDMAIEVLGLIYRLMKRDEDDKRLELEEAKNKLEEQEDEEDRRNKEIIVALTGRKKKKVSTKKVKEFGEKKEEIPEKEKPAVFRPSPSRLKVPEKPAPTSFKLPEFKAPSLGTAAKIAGGAAIVTVAGLGGSSAKFESNGDPSTVSSGMMGGGKVDPGGISYGTYQMSSTKGVADDFVKKSEFKKDFEGLKAGTPEFSTKWKELAKDPKRGKAFADAQHKYIEETHFQPAAKVAKQMGYKVEDPGVADAIWSMAVQHGGWKNVLEISNNIMGGTVNPDPKVEIRSLYEARNQYTQKLGMNLSGRYAAEVQVALKKSTEGSSSPVDVATSTGSKVDASSKENKDLKASLDKSKPNQTVVNNTYAETQSKETKKIAEVSDDTNPYLRKKG